MCNQIHRDKESRVRKIAESGVGWKIFSPKLGSMSGRFPNRYWSDKDRWIRWDRDLAYPDDAGFCFFRTKREAFRCLEAWNSSLSSNNIVRKIRYRGGLISQWEKGITNKGIFRIALCTEFKIED